MSADQSKDPRLEQSLASDDSLITAHEKASSGEPDTHAHYRLMPLVLLFVFSGLIFVGGTYLNRYSGHFHSDIFDERQLPGSGDGEAVAAVDPIALGRKQYNLACVTCHQANGQGVPNIYPPLAGSEWVTGSEERVISIVLHGMKGPVTVLGKTYNSAVMPAFGQVPGGGYNWSDQKIAAVLTYIRQEWGNAAGPIDTAKVTELKNQEAGRKEWTEAELLELP